MDNILLYFIISVIMLAIAGIIAFITDKLINTDIVNKIINILKNNKE